MSLTRPIRRLLAPILAAAVAGSLVAVTAPTSSAEHGTKRPDIVGGTGTNTAKYPWQVRLEVDTNEGTFLCGGAIIHSRIVLTAAHCLTGATGVTTYFGRDQASSGGVTSQPYGWITTDGYNASAFDNDYGLLFYDTPIPSAFRPIQIAGPGETTLWRAGRTATAVGFGNVSEGGSTSPTLQEVALPIQSDSTCSAPGAYGTFYRASSMLCVGYPEGGRSTCQGDSGGPLVVPGDNGVWRVAGVVSWAEGCARPGKPTVFTRIAEPAMSARLLAEINEVKTNYSFLFPGTESAINILGSGALPFGCTAANGVAASAAATAGAAQRAATKAAATLKKLKKQQKAATAKVKKLKKQHASKGAVAKANQAKKAATKKAKKAATRATATTRALAAANAASGAAATAASNACS
jgi:secreted trypsin-like serine protease